MRRSSRTATTKIESSTSSSEDASPSLNTLTSTYMAVVKVPGASTREDTESEAPTVLRYCRWHRVVMGVKVDYGPASNSNSAICC